MKINDAGKKPLEGASVTQARTGMAAAKSEAAAAPSDSVKISPGSQAYAGAPAFNAKKVEEIKLAMANGSFTVNPERIADGLIETVRDLIRQRKA
jgi:negative regulator of flagellin synthesis FlgM